MLVEVRVPVLAESVAEATLIDWHKQPGDAVKSGETLVDVETDKVTLEVVAPNDGILAEILRNNGEDVESDELIAQIDTAAQDYSAVTESAPENSPETTIEAESITESEPATEPEIIPAPEAITQPEPATESEIIPAPEAITQPEPATEPEIIPAPEATTQPEPATESEIIPTPEAITQPEPATEPEIIPAPEAITQPEPATEPEIIPAPEAITQPEPATEPEFVSRQQSLLEKEQQPDTRLSPAVRSLLLEHNLNAADIPVSGDRLTKENVLNYLAGLDGSGTEPEESTRADEDEHGVPGAEVAPAPMPDADEQAPAPPADRPAPPADRPAPPADRPAPPADEQGAGASAGPEKRVAMSRLRKRVAERLLAAQHENAILTTFNEVNMQPVLDLRSRYQEEFEKTHGTRLGFMSFFTRATVAALKKFPVINASVDGAEIVYHGYFDIGIAVSSPRGLVVPIIRAADTLGFAEIEKAIREYGEKARASSLTLEELTGGTFTITNGGVFGSLLSTPIINPPQSAILGMHKIQERPVVENGEIVPRPMMYLALSYDHRIIDGREAVSFLVMVKELLEDPSRLLLQV